MSFTTWHWIIFNVFVLAMLALDLGVFHRRSHAISMREALFWTFFWIGVSCIFGTCIYIFDGSKDGLEFAMAYLVEKSLSIDNIFVILMIFTYFKVPDAYQHKILFWGIIGALVMRITFILGGIALISKYHWIIYVFGSFLIFTGARMILPQKHEVSLEKNLILKLLQRLLPVTSDYSGSSFFVRMKGRITATPLFVALVMVETTDIVFAVDSIPAVLAISSNSFIVYTSNVFALLGMRSLFFAVSRLVHLFHHLKYGLAAILVFVGIKMLMSDFFKIPNVWALAILVSLLGASFLTSIIWPPSKKNE